MDNARIITLKIYFREGVDTTVNETERCIQLFPFYPCQIIVGTWRQV